MIKLVFLICVSLALLRMLLPLRRRSLHAIPWILCSILCFTMVSFPWTMAPYGAVFITDSSVASPEFLAQLDQKLSKLKSAGMSRMTMLTLDGPTVVNDVSSPLEWLNGSASASSLFAKARRTSSLEVAIRTAFDSGEEPNAFRNLWKILKGRQTRVFVCITETDIWKNRQPIDVSRLALLGLEKEGLVDVIEFAPQPRTLTLSLYRSRSLPALTPLASTGATVSATIRGASLKKLAGQLVRLTVNYRIDDRATCQNLARQAVVSSSGEINFEIPLNNCFDKTGKSPELSPGFALFQAEVGLDIAGAKWQASSLDYLSVDWTRVQVIVGEGESSDPLTAPSLLGPSRTAASIAMLDNLVGKQLRSARSGPNTHVEFISVSQLQASLRANGQLPDIFICYQLPYSIWTDEFCSQLAKAIKQGRNAVVIDPPPSPAGTSTADLALKKAMDFLPATSLLGRTVGTEPELMLVFDYGRMGDLARTPEGLPGQSARNVARSIDAQFTAANALIKFYKKENLLFGKLELLNGEVSYHSDARDKVLVRVAPKIDVPGSLLENLILPSALELRIASLFSTSSLPFVDINKSGLPDLSPNAQLSEYLRLTPLYAPNRVLVSFCLDTPQPNNVASRTSPLGVPELRYSVGGTSTQLKANPDGVLAQLLLRGVRLATIRLNIPAAPGDVSYAQGLREMTRKWPVPHAGPNPFNAFTIPLEETLGTKIDDAITQLTSASVPKFLLTAASAKNRMVAAARSPFFEQLDLTDASIDASASQCGERLAKEFLNAFASPKDSMAMTAIRNGLIVDERIPSHLLYDIESGLSRTTDLNSVWPLTERWSAPRRFRLLANNSDFPSSWRADYVVAVELRSADIKPIPLITAGRYGDGLCAVMAYDPFEVREPWWNERDTVFDPKAASGFADEFGVQRICDFIALCSRVRRVSPEEPRPSQVYLSDARGGLVVEVDFQSGSTLDTRLLQAKITSSTDISIPMVLNRIDWDLNKAVYLITAKELQTLLPKGLAGCYAKIELGSKANVNLYLKRPSDASWVDVSALESLATLSAITGGTLSDHANTTQPVQRHVRIVWSTLLMLLLAGTYAIWAMISLHNRFTQKHAGSYTQLSLTPLGIASEVANHVEIGEPLPKPSLNPVEYYLPISSGAEPGALSLIDLIKVSLGILTMPRIIYKAAQSNAKLTILVDAGQSMRVRCDGNYPKIYLAGVVAQMVAEYATRRGASVTVMVGGLRKGWQTSDWISSVLPGDVMKLVENAARSSPAPFAELPKLDLDFEHGVILISDMLTLSSDEVVNYARSSNGSCTKFGVVQIISKDEYRSVGVGFWSSPLQLVNRLGRTSSDLELAYKQQSHQLADRICPEGLGFVTINDSMTAGNVYESLDERLFQRSF